MPENSLGTLNGALILQKALRLCFTKNPLLRTVAKGFRDLDGKANDALFGQPVTSRIKTVSEVTDFSADPTAFDTSDVTLALNQFKKVHHKFTPDQYNSTDRDLIEEAAEPMARAIAQHVMASVAAWWTFANYPRRIVEAVANCDYDTIVDLKVAADGNESVIGIPDMDRFLVVNGSVHGEFNRDAMIVGYLNNQANAEAIRTGKLPDVQGFGLGNFPGLPSNSENLIGVAGTPDATMWLARAPKDPQVVMPGVRFPGKLGYVEDPITGFRVMVMQYIGTDLSINNVICWYQAFGPGNTNNLIRLVSANLASDDGS